MSKISAVSAMEILDSRGNPTVRVFLGLDCGIPGNAPRCRPALHRRARGRRTSPTATRSANGGKGGSMPWPT